MAREKVDNKLNVVIGTKAQVEGDTSIPENSIIVVTDEELKADEIVYSVEKNVKEAIDEKQDKLVAGENITIENNVISASGGGGGGASIGGGYILSISGMNLGQKFLVLGNFISYGFHIRNLGQIGNVSIVIFLTADSGNYLDTFTENSLIAYDGTVITRSNLYTYVGKILYLIANCYISFND